MDFKFSDFEYEYQQYNSMCERAKMLVLGYLLSSENCDSYAYGIFNGLTFKSKLTPIEQIFNAAYTLYLADHNIEVNKETVIPFSPAHKEAVIPFSVALIEEFEPQVEVEYQDKKYIVDFEINFSRKSVLSGDFIYPELKGYKYAIELDGHNYHSSKVQMTNDYERENNLKELGYSVIRFTGSQVYNDPIACVEKVINIIVSDIERKR